MPRRLHTIAHPALFTILGLLPMLTFVGRLHTADKPLDPDDLRPGLVVTYREEAHPGSVEIVQLDPGIALAWKADEAAHPRLASSGGTVHWDGYLNVLRAGNYRFSAVLRGRCRLSVGGKEVLAAESKTDPPAAVEGNEVRLEEGVQPLTAEFSRPAGVARLEVAWQGPDFRREPLPHDALGHLPKQEPDQLQTDSLAEYGRFLAEERNCTSCHRPDDNDHLAKNLQKRPGPDLSQVGQRIAPGWLYRWLESPRQLQSGALMPQLFTDDETGRVEREAVARFLVSLGGPLPEDKEPADKEKEREASRTRGKVLFTSRGCIACHQGEDNKKESPAASFYGLGSGSVRSSFPLSALGSKTTPTKLTTYLAQPLAIDPSGRMPNMVLKDQEPADLARYLCQSVDSTIPRELPAAPAAEAVLAAFQRLKVQPNEVTAFKGLAADAQVRELGKRLVLDRGCVNCHTVTPGGKPLASTVPAAQHSFADIRKAEPAGCLAAEVGQRGSAPWFGFGERERQALAVFLKEGSRGSGSPAPGHAARVAVRRFNCLACHTRDGEGGLTPEVVEELRRYEKAENAEAVVPPTLTGVAHKLRTPWMRQVLTQAGRDRPWMGLHMPQFGDAQVGRLPESFAALEGTEPNDRGHPVALVSARLEGGRFLAGKNAFGCISCHDLAGIPNTGTRGPDLAHMTEHVEYDWYRRWLDQPQRMQPGTRMPTVFNEGKTVLDQVLGGSADAQADAMWAYFSLGPNLPLPDGMEPRKGLVLTAHDRPLLLRTFMPEAGTRAIAVGYPDATSTAFDGTLCRLSYAWSGGFVDASPVWNDRGGNPAKVVGSVFWSAPPGCPWATSTSQEPPDFATRSKDPAYGAPLPEGKLYTGPRQLAFEGYSVDSAGLPTFTYRVQAAEAEPLEVRERPEPRHVTIAPGLARHFTLKVPGKQTAWLLAGECKQEPRTLDSRGVPTALDLKTGTTELSTAGRLLVLPQDGERSTVLAVAAPEASRWHVRRSGDRWQVLLRLPSAAVGQVQVDLNIWAPYRDEPGLKELLPPGP